ncbi:MAG: hypothetical protein MJ193_01965, partial [Clostridia bacterium]|nr:hypothetical protein [Clostridia bacterium]
MKRNKLLLSVLVIMIVCTVVLCACNKQPDNPKTPDDPSVSVSVYFYVDYQLYAKSKMVDGVLQDNIEDPVKADNYFTGWLFDESDANSTLASKTVDELIALTEEVLASTDKYICLYASFSKGTNVDGAGLLAFNYTKKESISSMEMNGETFTFVQKYTYNLNNKKADFTLDGKYKLSSKATYEIWEKTAEGDFIKSTPDVYLEFEYATATRYILVTCYNEEKKDNDRELYEFVIIRGLDRGDKDTFNATRYFSTLWSKTAALGQDAIDTTGFVAVALDFSAELNEVEVKTEKVNQAIAIGFHIEMVV